MSWWKTWFGPSSFDALAREATRWLEARGARDIQIDTEELRLRATSPTDHALVVSLGNVLAAYQRAARAQRAAVLEEFLEPALVFKGPGDGYGAQRAFLMPVVRHQANAALVALEVQVMVPHQTDSHPPASRSLAGDVALSLVLDGEDAMTHVTQPMLDRWKVSFDQALEDALHNLRGLPEQSGWADLGRGVWLGTWADSYESSRLLLPDLIHRLGVAEPVAMVPTRSTLLVASVRDEAALAHLLTMAEQALDVDERWLSVTLLRLDESIWRVFEAPDSLQTSWRMLMLRNQTYLYEQQKSLLDRQFKARNINRTVASFKAWQRSDGHITSMAVWTEGVDALLPVTDEVHFVTQGESGAVVARLDWSTVQSGFGAYLETTSYLPTRVLVTGWPGTAEIQRLAQGAAP